MKNITISVGIICKNEDRTIFNCLKAIQQQIEEYDEIIVVDTGSTDHTIEIIEGFRDVKLYTHKWNDDFSEARNVVISLSNNDWVFFIDSDEIIQSNGLNNLRKTIFEIEEVSSKPVVFCPKVLNSNDSIVYNSGRIIKNNGLFRFYGCIHEYPIYMNDINANNYSTIILDNTVMKHDGYADNIMIEKKRYVEILN